MSKIKNLISKMSDEIKELVKKFPLTIFVIVFLTIFAVSTLDQGFSQSTEEIISKIYFFCYVWAVGTFFTETFLIRKYSKAIGYGLTAIVSFAFMQILMGDVLKSDITINLIARWLIAYLAILILMNIYISIKNANLKFQEYILKFFRDILNMTTIYIILNIGTLMITTIFVELILDGEYGSLMWRLLILVLGLFYVPSIVYSISGISNKEINSFIKGLVLYVLLPLVMIAMTIIYIYIAKILIFSDMPQNIVFRILAGIFIAAFPVWNMASNYKEEKTFFRKVVNILPYLYVPFVFLEIYSIGVRIKEFGFTPMRYVSCLFIIFQVIVLFLTFYKKGERISKILIYASILVFICFIGPLNLKNVSNLSQKGIIEKILPQNMNFDDLNDESKEKVVGAYEYLDNRIGQKYIPDYLTDENKEKIETYFSTEYWEYGDYNYFYANKELELDISQYQKIIKVSGSAYDKTEIEFESIERVIDLEEYIEKIIEKDMEIENDSENYFKENNIVKINDKEDLYLSELSFEYYPDTEYIEYISLDGYLLQK